MDTNKTLQSEIPPKPPDMHSATRCEHTYRVYTQKHAYTHTYAHIIIRTFRNR